MKVLSNDEMKKAEDVLEAFLPQSYVVYGYIFQTIRVKYDLVDVIVDSWPNFTTVLCRPRVETEGDRFKDMSLFTRDNATLRKILADPAVINWEKYFCLAADLSQKAILKEEAESRAVSWKQQSVCHMLKLQDASDLPAVDSSPWLAVSSLNESDVDLVNQTWKFRNGQHSVRMIREMICHFPSCCLRGEDGQPVAWILMYSSGAMGILYTMPEHRGKGYAKILISVMSKRLHSQGFPVFCYIEEDNKLSYRLFKNLGFVEDPTYRQAWFEFNRL